MMNLEETGINNMDEKDKALDIALKENNRLREQINVGKPTATKPDMTLNINKPKRNYWKIFGIVILTLIILGALLYGILYAKSYYQNQAYQIGITYGINQVIDVQNKQGQWYYFADNNGTIGNVSVVNLCGSLK